MSDCVVTVPMNFTHSCCPGLRGLDAWVAEGDAAGDEEQSGVEWEFTTGGPEPNCQVGDRLYIVCEYRLRGYAPIVRVEASKGRVVFVRRGGAVAVTILERIVGFQGWRYRWWYWEHEVPFPDWRTANRVYRPSEKPIKEATERVLPLFDQGEQ